MSIQTARQKVYQIVKKIPKGKVTTYKEVGKATGISPRIVGYALHLNNNADVPCHRVVNIQGRIAPNFGLGGHLEQKKRLEDEGVVFKSEMYVRDLEEYLHKFDTKNDYRL